MLAISGYCEQRGNLCIWNSINRTSGLGGNDFITNFSKLK